MNYHHQIIATHIQNLRPVTKRFRKSVKIYRNLPTTSFSISPTSAEENRTNWAVRRVGLQTNGDGWPNTFGTQQ